MAALPLLDESGAKSRDVEVEDAVFATETKAHLIHETVRAELAASRAGTQSAKSRGLVSGGRGKPWRQKGTGRARAGTTRAPQWTGGGVAFAPEPRRYELKVNRKARKSALRGALAAQARRGSLALLDAAAFAEPSTKAAAKLVGSWGAELPLLVVAERDEDAVVKSFRNLDRTLVVDPSELSVGSLVWARSLILTERALARIQEVAA